MRDRSVHFGEANPLTASTVRHGGYAGKGSLLPLRMPSHPSSDVLTSDMKPPGDLGPVQIAAE